MSSRSKWFVAIALALFFCVACILLAFVAKSFVDSRASSAAAQTAPRKGFMAPDFSLQVLGSNARTISLKGYRGNRPVMINFWATWCPPCRAEMPAIQDAYEKYQAEGLVVLAVDQMEPARVVQPFVLDHGLTFPVLLDGESVAADAYRVRALPTTVFVRKDGTILDIVVGGPMSKTFIERRVRELLRSNGD
ncbi:MAG: redoxin domain-containing protein [Chloroflexi bacterium]|nr:redoxin domain-containing protein [Chloroflexota bacterium]